jgi:hypothetical protein
VLLLHRANVGGIQRNDRYWAAYGLNATDKALASITASRFSDTLFGGVVTGGWSTVTVSHCEFVRNDPSLVMQEDGLLVADACGFAQHSGTILQTLVYGTGVEVEGMGRGGRCRDRGYGEGREVWR